MPNLSHLVIGKGQIGIAVQKALKGCDAIGASETAPETEYEVLDICFGYSEEFESEVLRYKELYKPQYIVVHSTVPLGTCKRLGVYHSPVRGKHPDLYESLLTFKKYISGPSVMPLVEEYRMYGIPAEGVANQDDTEAMKLWDTTYYGWNIVFEKSVRAYCEANNLDFSLVYTEANETYNKGYQNMGSAEFTRPVLSHMPGKIGGHCVIPNCKLLKTPVADYILTVNETL